MICQRFRTIYTVRVFGCRSNQFDAEALTRCLDPDTYIRVGDDVDADLVLVVGCSVTHRADRDVRRYIQKTRRSHPGITIVLAGCSAESTVPDGVDIVVPMGLRENLQSLIEGGVFALPDRNISEEIFFQPITSMWEKSRIFLKIQEGCNHRCSYCIVPSLRGGSRSLPGDEVVGHIRDLAGQGNKEVVLTGTFLGGWGRDLSPAVGLKELLGEVDRLEGDFRLRLSSLEPWAVDEAFLECIAGLKRLCPFFHLPLQSGSPGVLRAMRRPMSTERFKQLISMIRDHFPACRIGTDMIVGFPGESDEDHRHTMRFLSEVQMDYHHIFSYSPRPGTAAAGDEVPYEEVRLRYREMKELDDRARAREAAGRQGEIVEVLSVDHRGIDHYNHWVEFESESEPGRFVMCRITGYMGDRLKGAMV